MNSPINVWSTKVHRGYSYPVYCNVMSPDEKENKNKKTQVIYLVKDYALGGGEGGV